MQNSNVFIGLLELAVPFYGLRLSRLFGTKQIGWALVMAFSALAVLHVTGWELAGIHADLNWTLIWAGVPMLCLIGMAHLEAVCKERSRVLQVKASEKCLELADQRATAFREPMAQVAAVTAQHFNRHLAVINLYTGLILRKGRGSSAVEHYRRVADEAVKASSLGKQLLAVGGTQPIRLRLLNIERFLVQSKATFWRLLGVGMSLETHCQECIPHVKADATQLHYILTQLVSNAVEANGPGAKVSIRAESIRVSASQARRHPGARSGRFVRLTVSDAGCGISQEGQEHLFEPFYTTKDRDRHAGLGLASSYGLVKEHNGWMEVESEPNRGCNVHIFLPVSG